MGLCLRVSRDLETIRKLAIGNMEVSLAGALSRRFISDLLFENTRFLDLFHLTIYWTEISYGVTAGAGFTSPGQAFKHNNDPPREKYGTSGKNKLSQHKSHALVLVHSLASFGSPF